MLNTDPTCYMVKQKQIIENNKTIKDSIESLCDMLYPNKPDLSKHFYDLCVSIIKKIKNE